MSSNKDQNPKAALPKLKIGDLATKADVVGGGGKPKKKTTPSTIPDEGGTGGNGTVGNGRGTP